MDSFSSTSLTSSNTFHPVAGSVGNFCNVGCVCCRQLIASNQTCPCWHPKSTRTVETQTCVPVYTVNYGFTSADYFIKGTSAHAILQRGIRDVMAKHCVDNIASPGFTPAIVEINNIFPSISKSPNTQKKLKKRLYFRLKNQKYYQGQKEDAQKDGDTVRTAREKKKQKNRHITASLGCENEIPESNDQLTSMSNENDIPEPDEQPTTMSCENDIPESDNQSRSPSPETDIQEYDDQTASLSCNNKTLNEENIKHVPEAEMPSPNNEAELMNITTVEVHVSNEKDTSVCDQFDINVMNETFDSEDDEPLIKFVSSFEATDSN